MKILLAILCGLMVLFAGGCAIVAVAAGPLALIPAGIAALNVLVLIALFGTSKPKLWAFYTLVILDLAGILILAGIWASFGITDNATNWLGAVLIGSLAVKAIVTFAWARRVSEGRS